MDKEQTLGWSLVPPKILANENITSSAKLVWGRIKGLENKKGYCWASNKFIAQSMALTKGTVSNLVKQLIDENLLKRQIIRGEDEQIKERRLWTQDDTPSPAKDGEGYTSNDGDLPSEGWKEEVESSDRDKSNSTIKDSTDEKEKDDDKIDFDELSIQELTQELKNNKTPQAMLVAMFDHFNPPNWQKYKDENDLNVYSFIGRFYNKLTPKFWVHIARGDEINIFVDDDVTRQKQPIMPWPKGGLEDGNNIFGYFTTALNETLKPLQKQWQLYKAMNPDGGA